jgi:hypothetical protein
LLSLADELDVMAKLGLRDATLLWMAVTTLAGSMRVTEDAKTRGWAVAVGYAAGHARRLA